MKQIDLVLEHLKTNHGITAKEAQDLYGIQRLASRVTDLKELGFNVVCLWETGKNRYGDPTRWKRYFLQEDSRDG